MHEFRCKRFIVFCVLRICMLVAPSQAIASIDHGAYHRKEMKVATTRDSPTELLLAGLQGIYSRLLYGAAGRLDLDHA